MQRKSDNTLYDCPQVIQYGRKNSVLSQRKNLLLTRPKFSYRFQRLIPVESGQARRHIISFDVMKGAFIRVLETNDPTFNRMADSFICSYGKEPDHTSLVTLAEQCLKILNENPKNFVVDDSKVNSALGVIAYQIKRVIDKKSYVDWADGIMGSEAIDEIIHSTSNSSVHFIIKELKDSLGTVVLHNLRKKRDFLNLLYDNMSFDIMNREPDYEQRIIMGNILQQDIYNGFITANSADDLFRVCKEFMNL